MILQCQDIGLKPYNEVWRYQEQLREKRLNNEIADTLILCEHHPVFTLGKRDCEHCFISSREEISKDGIDIIKTNRGGLVTYHGPGQLVGYFICSLDNLKLGVKDFVNRIEEICIRTLADLKIHAERSEVNPGVWIGNKKIAAIGLNISQGITQHGFALNVAPDLTHYRHIVACGLKDCGVTSIEKELGTAPNMDDVKRAVVKYALL